MATLEELENEVWGEPEFDSSLVLTCHALRKKDLDQFTVEDLRIMVGQGISMPILLPRAIAALERDPLAEGAFFPGDLLSALLRKGNRPSLAALAAPIKAVCKRALALLERLDDQRLPDGRFMADSLVSQLRGEIEAYLDQSVMWPPLVIGEGAQKLMLRVATQADVPMLDMWDREPSVIACTTDDPEAEQAFQDAYWPDEVAANSDVTCYYIAELDGRPIGAMQVIDPHRESTHYWGEIGPGSRAIDIWIGAAEDRNKGYGAAMMRAVIDRCFDDPDVTAIVIDPLASNIDAHRFYQRLGFHPVGRRLFNGEDDCLVHRLERDAWRSD